MHRLFRALILATFVTHATVTHASASCTSIVANAQDAADKADVVIEGAVTLVSYSTSPPVSIHVVTEKSRGVFDLEPARVHATMSLTVDSCFPGKEQVFSKQAAGRIEGKTMRFYLTRLTSSRGYLLFFMQPVEAPVPAFRKTPQAFVTRGIPDARGTPLADGWSQAHSTDGKFSIAMPGTFLDATKGGPGEPGFILRGQDQNGSTYLAVFERSGPAAEMAGTFDDMYAKADAVIAPFKGAMAVTTVGSIPGPDGNRTSYGKWLRVPGGTFMLGVVASKGHEAQALQNKERFFNSLEFQ